MADKLYIPIFKFILFILILSFSFEPSNGQQTPDYPISYRIFCPLVINPAIVGSKDFSSIDFISGWQGKSNSQIIGINSRLTKKGPSYFLTSSNRQYSHFGIGGYLFNEKKSPSRNLGLGVAGSYQIPLNQQ